jgi:DNA-binding PadR family transcriptional regulator
MANPNFMNGVPEFLILRLLSRQEMYGYELVQGIRLSMPRDNQGERSASIRMRKRRGWADGGRA